MAQYEYQGIKPEIHPMAFVANEATLIGDVHIGEQSSVWYGTTMRGDVMPLRVGKRTSIQDNSVVHATHGWSETRVGDDCTVGHSVILHGCIVGHRVLVGMGSILLDAVEVGDDVLIGAGTLLTARTKIPSGVLVMGRPGKVIREINDKERMIIAESAQLYVGYGKEHQKLKNQL